MKAARRAGWRAAEKTKDQVTEWIVPLGVGRPDPRPAHPGGTNGPPVSGRSAFGRVVPGVGARAGSGARRA